MMKYNQNPQKHNEAVWDGLPTNDMSWADGGC